MATQNNTRKTAPKKPTDRQQPQDGPREVTSARQWRRASGEDLTLPSGHVVRAKRPGPSLLLQEGVMPDSLTAIIHSAIKDAKGMPPEDQKALFEDPSKLVDVLEGIDKMVTLVVMEPTVVLHRRPILDAEGVQRNGKNGKPLEEDIPFHEREEDLVYTDEIDQDDKMFVFQYAIGGTRDLETFRTQQLEGVGALQAGEDVADAS